MVGGWDTKNSHNYSVLVGDFNILALLPFKLVPNILRLTLTKKNCREQDLTDLTYLLEISSSNQNKLRFRALK